MEEYQVLIVDDELIERNGLKSLFEQAGFPARIRLSADGEQAMQIMQEGFKPDVLLTDIQMPFVNGLDLAAWTHHAYPTTQIIIFTAYDEFEYARTALTSGVTDYLLKPIDLKAFNTMLERTHKCLAEKKRQAEMEDYLRQQNQERQLRMLLDRHSKELFTLWTGQTILVMYHARQRYFDSFDPLSLERPVCAQQDAMILDERSMLVFYHDLSWEERPTESIKHIAAAFVTAIKEQTGDDCLALISDVLESPLESYHEYSFMDDILDHTAGFHHSDVLFVALRDASRPQSTIDILHVVKEATVAMEMGSVETVTQNLRQMRNQVQGLQRPTDCCLGLMLSDLYRSACAHFPNFKQYPLAKEIDACDTISAYVGVIDSMIRMLPEDSRRETAPSELLLIRKVKKILDEHYAEDLGLESIAEMVGRTPGYIGSLFKRETGKPITRYLAEARMRQAVHLLETTEMKSSEIASAVGYASPAYFGQVFKSLYNMTPMTYRERSLKV